MATTLENLEGLERKAILSISVDEINSRVAAKLKNIQKKARIDGFRPGKAPFSMIENIYGASTQNDVLNDVAVDTFSKVAAEEKWKVAALQKLTVEDNQDDEKVLKIAAIFETFPEVKVGDLSNTEIEKVVANISDEDIDKTIEVIRKQRVRYEYVDRAAQNGDRVIIKFEGKIDGTPFAGGSADNYPFVLGEGRMLPEFEQGVIGLKEKETKDVSVTFPEDYHGKDVAGKTAIFTITVNNVAEAKLPELDDSFARTLGIEDGKIETLKEEIKKNLSREIKRRSSEITKENVMKALLDATKIDLPKSLVSQETERLRKETLENFNKQGLNTKNMGELPNSLFEEQANRRVALGLIMSEIVDANNLTPSEEQVREVVSEFAENYEKPQEVVDWYMKDKKHLQGPTSIALEANVVDFVLKQAKVKEKNMNFDELMYGNGGMPSFS